jgi:hypothetical protein
MLIGYAGFSTDDQKSRRLEKWFGDLALTEILHRRRQIAGAESVISAECCAWIITKLKQPLK